MDNYLDSFREMISLRGLTAHTLKNYCTYIRAYLDYLSSVLRKLPEDVSWDELRVYIRWLKRSRNLSDRTVNCAISQLRWHNGRNDSFRDGYGYAYFCVQCPHTVNGRLRRCADRRNT